MNTTAPISLGILAISGLFGIIAAGVAFVLYDYGVISALVIGGIVGAIAAFVLALGWREPLPGPHEASAPVAKPAPAPPPALAPVPAAKVETSAPAPAAKKTQVSAPKPAADGTPEFLSAARDGGPDDLKQIKGVGPKLEKTLHDMGIFHFDQIASWGPKEQAWMDENLEGFKGRATRDAWVSQAKTLASGGTTAFANKVKEGDVY